MPDTALSDLLAELSRQSGVALECEEDLARRPITTYLPGTRLKDVMAELARFLPADWWPEQDEGERRYTLRKNSELRSAESDLYEYLLNPKRAPKRASPQEANVLAGRLREYAQAFALPEQELLDRYLDSDPWLAETLSDPLTRGFVPLVTTFSRDQLLRLTSEPLILRVSELPAAVRSHTERWANGTYGPLDDFVGWVEGAEGKRAPRFQNWNQRWSHATLRISWLKDYGMQIHLVVPDVCQILCEPVRPRDVHPGQAWARIFNRQHPEPTQERIEEYRAKVDPKLEAWNRRAEIRERAREREQREAFLKEHDADWSDRELLTRKLVPWPSADMTTGAELLVRIAKECAVPLLADSDRQSGGTVSRRFREETTVQDGLELVARRLGYQWIWSKPVGRFLTVRAASEGLRAMLSMRLACLPPEVEVKWEQMVEGKRTLTIEECAEMLSMLTPLQRALFHVEPPDRWRVLTHMDILSWFRPDGEPFRRLLAGEEVRLSELTESERRYLLIFALENSPWLRETDLEGSTIRLQRYRDRGGEGVGAFIVDYHLPDDPADRAVFEPLRLSVPVLVLPAAQPAETSPPAPAPTPEQAPPEYADASLFQTGWLFRGLFSAGPGPSGVLTNNSTGEMELVQVNDSFRGMTVTGIAPDSVTLTSPDGNKWAMAVSSATPEHE